MTGVTLPGPDRARKIKAQGYVMQSNPARLVERMTTHTIGVGGRMKRQRKLARCTAQRGMTGAALTAQIRGRIVGAFGARREDMATAARNRLMARRPVKRGRIGHGRCKHQDHRRHCQRTERSTPGERQRSRSLSAVHIPPYRPAPQASLLSPRTPRTTRGSLCKKRTNASIRIRLIVILY